jgi:hypothetical protein
MTSLHVTDTQLGTERARTPPTLTDADRPWAGPLTCDLEARTICSPTSTLGRLSADSQLTEWTMGIGAEALQPDELCQTRRAAIAVRNRIGRQAHGRPTAYGLTVVSGHHGLMSSSGHDTLRTLYVSARQPVDSTVTCDCDGAPNQVTTAVGRSNFSSLTNNQPSDSDLDFARLHPVRTCFNNCIDCRNKCVKVFSAERGYSCGVFSVYGDDVCDEFSHIQSVIDNLPDDLTKEQRA